MKQILFVLFGIFALQDACADEPIEYKHELGGHVYLPSLTIPSSFPDSEALLSIAVGSGSYTTPVLSTFQNLKLASFSPIIAGQVAVSRRVAIALQVDGVMTAGTNAISAAQYGASVQYDFRLAGVWELIRSDSTEFSAALAIQRPHVLAVSPIDAIQNSISQIQGSSNPDFTSGNIETTLKPTLRVAHTFNPVFALRGFLGLQYFIYNSIDTSSASWKSSGGIGLDADLDPAFNVPIGITLNYTRAQVLVASATNTDTFTIGLFETFQKAHNFGFELGKTNQNGISSTIIAMALRAYYN